MALHRRDDVRSNLDADIYGSRAANVSIPKFRLAEAN